MAAKVDQQPLAAQQVARIEMVLKEMHRADIWLSLVALYHRQVAGAVQRQAVDIGRSGHCQQWLLEVASMLTKVDCEMLHHLLVVGCQKADHPLVVNCY